MVRFVCVHLFFLLLYSHARISTIRPKGSTSAALSKILYESDTAKTCSNTPTMITLGLNLSVDTLCLNESEMRPDGDGSD